MFGFEWSLLVKIIYGWGGSVYNLKNVPLDVDPKCIFVVQIYYRVFFFLRIILFLFGAWGGAGGAVTSCLKLHEVFTDASDHQIFISVSAVDFGLSLSLSDREHPLKV